MKKSFLLAMLIFYAVFTKAQDVIIKNDSTKIQSKVIELTGTTIKYKKWENQDGPLYNIALNEVNMIVYANGQKEIIKPSISNLPVPLGNTTDLKTQKVKYKPSRITVGLQSPLSIATSEEYRIVKNIFNIGYDINIYSTPKDSIHPVPFSLLIGPFGSFYAPINRLFRNYEKQDKGLFLFAHAGYGWTMIVEEQFDEFENQQNKLITSGGFVWSGGMDYYIVKGFGFTVSAFEFKDFYGGIVFSFK
jgi:hypothetical protein